MRTLAYALLAVILAAVAVGVGIEIVKNELRKGWSKW